MRYIYGLVDPRDKRIKYVGQTNDLDRRYEEHCEAVETTTKAAWIQELRLADTKPVLIVLDECPDPQADYLETWWIVVGRKQGWHLENGTYPTRQKLGKDFSALFADNLMEMYTYHVGARHEINRETVRVELLNTKAMLTNFTMLICAVIIFSYLLASGIISHNFNLMITVAPVVAYLAGIKLLQRRSNAVTKQTPVTRWTLLEEGALSGLVISFVTLACFALLEMGKLMK